ncbi:MAG TPA: hypothetical protein VMW16_16290 [Sedimentisphaerales bacterium]|nr:hypothetical protein [Sedimentisphaerales bacterium]
MAKYRTGLHKEISSIFNGSPVPKNNGAEPAPRTPLPAGAPPEQHREPNEWRFEIPVSPEQPLPAPEVRETPEQKPPTQSPPEAVPRERPKPRAVMKSIAPAAWQRTFKQIKNKLFAQKPGVDAARQKTMTLLVPVLFIVFIFVFVKVVVLGPGKTSGATTSGPANVVAVSETKIDWQIPPLYPATLRDPMQFGFVTAGQEGSETGTLIVGAIVYSEDNPAASIGRQIVHEGDKVSGVTVVKINKDSVEFESNGRRWTQKVQKK